MIFYFLLSYWLRGYLKLCLINSVSSQTLLCVVFQLSSRCLKLWLILVSRVWYINTSSYRLKAFNCTNSPFQNLKQFFFTIVVLSLSITLIIKTNSNLINITPWVLLDFNKELRTSPTKCSRLPLAKSFSWSQQIIFPSSSHALWQPLVHLVLLPWYEWKINKNHHFWMKSFYKMNIKL